MRLNFFKHLMVIVIFAGLFYSCDKDDDIDMSKIDFSNIENLHEQPLQVIQKCVEGKWLWYSSCCGISGQPNYSDDIYVTIFADHYIVEYPDGQYIKFFIWKKTTAFSGYNSWMMWDKELDKASWYFVSIKNDTLSVINESLSGMPDAPAGYGFIRIK